MPELVIADTSCLIVLDKIGRLELLKRIFGKITVTQVVQSEFGQPLPDWVEIVDFSKDLITQSLLVNLDLGEASSIAFALASGKSMILMDERKGRDVAQKLNLRVIGTLGILILAKKSKHINSLRAEFEKIKQTNFRISDELITELLNKYD